MKENKKLKNIAVLGADTTDVARLCAIIESGPYRTNVYADLTALTSGLRSEPSVAAILDIDSVSLDNRTIRRLTLENPAVCFLCTSQERVHPELEDAICYHLFACLHKPVNPDELHYFLKCIYNNETDSRGPPAR